MTDQPGDTTKPAPRRKGRSPSYPGIDVGLALDRARQLWEREHHYDTAVPTILEHWGYGAKSGGGFAALAALKTFGLLADEGNGPKRSAKLTPLAQDIITAEDPQQRQKLVQKAALMPQIHAELWQLYGAKLPSDQTLSLFLIRERGFTPSGASELVSEWKRTMTHAQLTTATDSVPANAEDSNAGTGGPTGRENLTPPATIDRDEKPPVDHRQQHQPRTIQVPYSPSEWALVQAPFPMTESAWTQMLAVLAAMKPGLVQDDPQ